MKFVIVFVAIVSVALAAHIPIIEHSEIRDEAGQYAIRYLTGDGIAVAERGSLKPNSDHTDNILVIEGTYSYNGPDGKTYTVTYRGDENGFTATGDHLPVSDVVA